MSHIERTTPVEPAMLQSAQDSQRVLRSGGSSHDGGPEATVAVALRPEFYHQRELNMCTQYRVVKTRSYTVLSILRPEPSHVRAECIQSPKRAAKSNTCMNALSAACHSALKCILFAIDDRCIAMLSRVGRLLVHTGVRTVLSVVR